ncbi:MAG: DNA repair protein RecO [Deltaproteobacteria bacterium]|nr:DNA repair protein RecO [Deltaproteobacteria bacterium]
MPAFSTQAIVLQAWPTGEADVLVDFLTPTQGRLRGVAKGAKKSRKRFANCLGPACWIRLQLYEKSTNPWVRLEAGELIDSFEAIRKDFRKWGVAGVLCELTRELVPPRDPHPAVFELLRESLQWLDGRGSAEEVGPIFQLKILRLAGYGLSLTACPVCGKAGNEFKGAVYSSLKAVLLCPECCAGEEGLRLSPGTLHSLRQADRLEAGKAFRIRLDARTRQEAEELLTRVRRQVIGRELSSAYVLRQLQEPYG